MQYTKIKNISVSKIALGTWAIGGGKDWGANEEACSIAAIHKALEEGINFIDTAPIYGLGNAENVVGKALQGKRQDAVLMTKCGLKPTARAVEFNLKPESIRTELEDSLKRLRTDYIDFFLIHRPDRETPLEDTLGEMSRLKEAGKIRHYGVSNFGPQLLEKAAAIADIACVQNEYSYLKRTEGESVFNICSTKKIAFLAYGPLAGGLLTGKYKKEPNLARCDVKSFFYKFYKGDDFKNACAALAKFTEIAARHKGTLAQTAINWCLAEPTVTCVLAGARKPEQIAETAAATDWQLTEEDIKYLNETY